MEAEARRGGAELALSRCSSGDSGFGLSIFEPRSLQKDSQYPAVHS